MGRALITGGGRGIGAAIAIGLAEAGHAVVLNYRSDHEAAAAVRRQILDSGGQADLSCFDVTDPSATETAIEGILSDPRPLQILVHNAGVIRDGLFASLERQDWEIVLETALDGFYNVTRPVVRSMIRRRHGRIINIASYSGIAGNRGQVNYSAAKAGLIGATKALAQEVAKRGITVNAVAPGAIDTKMILRVPRHKLLERVPMRRLGEPREVAALVCFLASDEASYITGQVIGVNGGMI